MVACRGGLHSLVSNLTCLLYCYLATWTGVECVPSQCDQGTRFDGVKGQHVPTTTAACPTGRVCNLQLDTDDWYYGTHIEHAFTTGECVVPCENENDTSCGTGKICQSTDNVVGKRQPLFV
jgi:hypothetical protein